jgi:hypothetical protein
MASNKSVRHYGMKSDGAQADSSSGMTSAVWTTQARGREVSVA